MNGQKRNSCFPLVLFILPILIAGPSPLPAQSNSALQVLKSRPSWKDFPPAFLNFLAARLETAENAAEFAKVYEETGFLDRQKEGFSRASSDDGLDLTAGIMATSLTNYGNEMGGQRKYQEAKKAVELAMLIRPRHLAAWQSLAISLYFLGDCKNAALWSEKALEFKPDPNSTDAWERQLANDPGAAEQRKRAESFLKKIIAECSGKK